MGLRTAVCDSLGIEGSGRSGRHGRRGESQAGGRRLQRRGPRRLRCRHVGARRATRLDSRDPLAPVVTLRLGAY